MKRYGFMMIDDKDMSLDEIEILRLLYRHMNFDTNIAGYTVNQLVVNSDKRLNLTTQKVRTILKKFEKEGYIQFVSSGSKGKESTLKITIKQQLFNNNATNKSEELQQIEGNEQQQSNNNVTTLSKKKKKDNNNIYSLVIDYLNIKANTSYRINTKNTQSLINARVKEGFTVEDFKKVIDSKSNEWLNTDFEKYLRPATLFGGKFENYLNEANKKAPTAIGTQKNNLVNPNICNNDEKYTRGVKML
jgi:uncharacterized phage protein (TIGR02220 family)